MENKVAVTSYQTENGKNPFGEWIDSLDNSVVVKIDSRLDKLAADGHYGNHSILKAADNIIELRFNVGPGYRIYCHKDGSTLVILLCAGNKKGYKTDIKKALGYWKDYQKRKE